MCRSEESSTSIVASDRGTDDDNGFGVSDQWIFETQASLDSLLYRLIILRYGSVCHAHTVTTQAVTVTQPQQADPNARSSSNHQPQGNDRRGQINGGIPSGNSGNNGRAGNVGTNAITPTVTLGPLPHGSIPLAFFPRRLRRKTTGHRLRRQRLGPASATTIRKEMEIDDATEFAPGNATR